jgi:hypothetical protein
MSKQERGAEVAGSSPVTWLKLFPQPSADDSGFSDERQVHPRSASEASVKAKRALLPQRPAYTAVPRRIARATVPSPTVVGSSLAPRRWPSIPRSCLAFAQLDAEPAHAGQGALFPVDLELPVEAEDLQERLDLSVRCGAGTEAYDPLALPQSAQQIGSGEDGRRRFAVYAAGACGGGDRPALQARDREPRNPSNSHTRLHA